MATSKNSTKAKKKSTPKTTAKKTSKPNTKSSTKNISHDERYKLISQSAYYLAEKRGFIPGGEVHDWLEAEELVDQEISTNGWVLAS